MNVRVPGDKSLSQRALILSALASGTSRIRGLLHGGDAASTRGALTALGVDLPEIPSDGAEIVVPGVGLHGLRNPRKFLDLGNSGTGTRLLLGVLAGTRLSATLTGDASLRARPMRRVTDPLTVMGARFEYPGHEGRLPLTVRGRHPLSAIDWTSPVASAQVKSAVLLAGLTGQASVRVTEPKRSRDHTERMLTDVGATVRSWTVDGGWRVALENPPESLEPLDFDVPGDFSSAAFLLAFALLRSAEGSITVEDVGLNPTRTAFLGVLERMGATFLVDPVSDTSSLEPRGHITAEPSSLRGVSIGGTEIPGLIDELPLAAVLGARASGTTTIRDAAELRAKESDRIRAVVRGLRAVGVEAEEFEDGLQVEGTDRPLAGRVTTEGDHRIAMAFGILGALPGNRIEVDEPTAADVSFPGFWTLLARLAARDDGANPG